MIVHDGPLLADDDAGRMASFRRRTRPELHRLVSLALVVTLASASIARASQGSANSSQQSGDSSAQSGGSSEGSANSSQQTGEGSAGTGRASETSGGTSESTGKSSQDSAGSSNGSSGQSLAIASVIVVVGGTLYSGWLLAATTFRQQQRADAQLERFLREHHALVTRDVLAGSGPVLDDWYASLGLDASERARVTAALDRSEAQGKLLAALDGVTRERARTFAATFVELLDTALGRERFAEIARAAGS